MNIIDTTSTAQTAVNEFCAKYGDDVHATDAKGLTLLHTAMAFEDIDIVTSLVLRGADVNARSQHGWTPLHYASLYNDIGIINFLISQGANINIAGNCGCTPLHWAIGTNAPIAKFFISKGADINAECMNYGSPLDLAAKIENSAMLNYFSGDEGIGVKTKP